jgi:N-ethylmaleimide reductase
MSELLFTPYTLGTIELKNRVVMAPMTRSRAIGNVPNDLIATYYAQRAEAGLLITEGTSPSPNGLGYPRIPGLFNAEQVEGWKKTTSAVHAAGSKIFVQLMHTGRVSHPLNMPAGAKLGGPSAIATPGEMHTDAQGPQPYPVPEVMSEEDIEREIQTYVDSSALAIEAGFDGVELHGANGYLIEQFLNVGANQRSDRWGGSVENRARFALEVATRVAAKIGKGRVGIRLSPYGVFNGTTADEHTDALYTYLAQKLNDIGILYVHVVDHSAMGAPAVKPEVKKAIRDNFRGTYILSGGYDLARAEVDLAEKKGELVAFGRPFLSNPRLVSKLKSGAALIPPDFSTFYTPGEKGYTDFPVDG